MRILIAEDDRTTARVLSSLIGSWGYDVAVAETGVAALEAFSGSAPPHMALLDWMLPDLDGPEVCRRVHRLSSARPVYIILLTARTASADIVAGLDAGADEYLTKPFEVAELRARLNAGARVIDLQQRLGDQVRELETALSNVRKLSGLLPICAYCKSIRDDSNYWHRVEEYVSEHAEVRFSHSICPKCLPKVMADALNESER